jgi:hypothetical protein
VTALAQPLTLETAFRLIAELQALVDEQAKTIQGTGQDDQGAGQGDREARREACPCGKGA